MAGTDTPAAGACAFAVAARAQPGDHAGVRDPELPHAPARPLDPPTRLLTGPGPSNVSPEVQAAMQRPQLGHLDPAFLGLLDEIVEMQRQVYGAATAPC